MQVITQFSASSLTDKISSINGFCLTILILSLFSVMFCVMDFVFERVLSLGGLFAVLCIGVMFVSAIMMSDSIEKSEVYNFSVVKIEESDRILDLVDYEDVVPIGDNIFIVRPSISNTITDEGKDDS